MVNENNENLKGSENVDGKAETSDLQKEKKQMKEEEEDELRVYIGNHDELEEFAQAKSEEPQDMAEISKKNAQMKKDVENYWRELHAVDQEVEESAGGESSVGKSEQVKEGIANVQETPSESSAEKKIDQPSEEVEVAIEKPAGKEEIADTKVEFDSVEAGTQSEDKEEKELTEEEVKERADAIESTEEYFFGEGKRSQAEQSMVEEYKNAEKEDAENNNTAKTDEVIAKTGQGFAEKLKLPPNYKEDTKVKKEIVDAKLAIDEKLMNSEMMQGAENGEINFMAIIDKGQKLLQEGNPEEIKKYFGGMADTLDDCAKRSQYIYVRMEGDPEMKAALKDEYITLVTNVQKFGEASEVMRKLAKKAETAQEEHRALTAEEMEEMTSLLDVLRKAVEVMLVLGAALYSIAEYSKKFAVAHPIVAKIVGGTTVVAGTKAATMVIPAAAAGKGLFWIGAFIALMKEKKRDDVIQAIFQFKLPAALQAKDDSKKEGK